MFGLFGNKKRKKQEEEQRLKLERAKHRSEMMSSRLAHAQRVLAAYSDIANDDPSIVTGKH